MIFGMRKEDYLIKFQEMTGLSWNTIILIGAGLIIFGGVLISVSFYWARRARRKCRDNKEISKYYYVTLLGIGLLILAYKFPLLGLILVPLAIGLNFAFVYIAHKSCSRSWSETHTPLLYFPLRRLFRSGLEQKSGVKLSSVRSKKP